MRPLENRFKQALVKALSEEYAKAADLVCQGALSHKAYLKQTARLRALNEVMVIMNNVEKVLSSEDRS